jgi:hypothetical protein
MPLDKCIYRLHENEHHMLLNASAGASIENKTDEEAKELI